MKRNQMWIKISPQMKEFFNISDEKIGKICKAKKHRKKGLIQLSNKQMNKCSTYCQLGKCILKPQ